MWDFDTEVGEIIPRTPSIRSFRFPVRANNVRFRAGQYQYVTIRVGDGTDVHHFSISSSPTEKGYLETTKRLTDHPFSQALAHIRPGDWVHLRGPDGEFTLPARPRKIGFLTGGIGITAQRSILRYIVDKGLPFDAQMLYGNATWEDICFRDELDGMARNHSNVRVTHVLTSPPPGWTGPTGLINAGMIKQLIPDYAERMFFVCGPPKMVQSLMSQLQSIGVSPRDIKHDDFRGYDD